MIRHAALFVALSTFLPAARPAEARHHPDFKAAFKRAVQIRGIDSIRVLFEDDAWEGRKGSLAGRDLDKVVREAKSLHPILGGQLRRDRVVMSLQYSLKAGDRPEWYLILAKPTPKKIVVKVGGKEFHSNWRVTRLTSRSDSESASVDRV